MRGSGRPRLTALGGFGPLSCFKMWADYREGLALLALEIAIPHDQEREQIYLIATLSGFQIDTKILIRLYVVGVENNGRSWAVLPIFAHNKGISYVPVRTYR